MPSSSAEVTSFDVTFPLALYNADALKRAAYAIMHRATVKLDVTNDLIRCTITPTSEKEDASIVERDFLREVTDHDLRITVEAQTEQARTAILALTFSRTGLQG